MRFEEAFQSQEYTSFKDAVSKSTSDNRLVIKNNNVVVGKSKVPIPSFVNIEDLRALLEEESLTLYKKYQDLYDVITIAEKPERYRKDYEETVRKLEDIQEILAEAQSFIKEKNAMLVDAPIAEIEQRIKNNSASMASTLDSMSDNVHVEKKKIQKVLKLYKENMALYQKLEEAQNSVDMDYVIYDKGDKGGESAKTVESAPAKSVKKKQVGGGKIDEVQRAAIKTLVKKLMIDKLL